MNRQTYRLFGIPVFSIEYEFDSEHEVVGNTGGIFERAEAEDEYDEEYDEDEYCGFGFSSGR